MAEYKKQNKVPKAFKVNIKPQVQNPDTKFILAWEKAASNFGLQLVDILIDYWENQIVTFSKEILTLKETIGSLPQEQSDLIYKTRLSRTMTQLYFIALQALANTFLFIVLMRLNR